MHKSKRSFYLPHWPIFAGWTDKPTDVTISYAHLLIKIHFSSLHFNEWIFSLRNMIWNLFSLFPHFFRLLTSENQLFIFSYYFLLFIFFQSSIFFPIWNLNLFCFSHFSEFDHQDSLFLYFCFIWARLRRSSPLPSFTVSSFFSFFFVGIDFAC